jgi:hypothetical protein
MELKLTEHCRPKEKFLYGSLERSIKMFSLLNRNIKPRREGFR